MWCQQLASRSCTVLWTMQIFPPGQPEGSRTPTPWGTSSVVHVQPVLLQHFLFFGSFSLPWHFFSPHQSLMLLRSVSSFCEDGSTVTPLCPQEKLHAQASSRRESPPAPRSALLAGPASGQKKQVQEEDKEQHAVPSFTVHPPFLLQTQEMTLASSVVYTQAKSSKAWQRLDGKKNPEFF